MSASSKKTSGSVVSIAANREYGFIRGEDFDRDIFFSFRDLPSASRSIQVGSLLSGVVRESPKGLRLHDIKVTSAASTNPYVFFSLVCLAVFAFSCLILRVRFETDLISTYVIAVNISALIFMGLDKSMARSGALRTPETILYVLAVIGGSPGIFVGAHVFKHKTRKASFQFVLLLIATAQIALARML